jgi:CheY-like chemotaxis protein
VRLIEEFSAVGAAVSVRSRGRPRSLAPQAEEAAYRVIEEGLTNAIRHAPGQPVSATVGWEAGTLLLTVANAADCRAYAPGSGLAGLDRRLRQAGGLLGHELSGGLFRLHAVLPATLPSGARQRSGVNALVRAGIRTVLESAAGIVVVAEAGDGRAAVEAALASRPDVALMDIKMPVLDEMTATGEFRRQVPGVRIVILTSFGTQPNVQRAIQQGTVGQGRSCRTGIPISAGHPLRARHDPARRRHPRTGRGGSPGYA